MSAPKTNIETQARRHSVALGGIAAVCAFALVLLGGFYVWTTFNGEDPEGAEVQIQPGIGPEAGPGAD